MDRIDRDILAILQKDSRGSIAETAEKVGLSLSACHRRIAALEEKGVIEKYSARVNGRALDFNMLFFVEVSLDNQTDAVLAEFEQAARNKPEVLECHLMTGSADYLLKVAAADTTEYERTYRRTIASLPHVQRIESSLVMKSVKQWDGYPTHKR